MGIQMKMIVTFQDDHATFEIDTDKCNVNIKVEGKEIPLPLNSLLNFVECYKVHFPNYSIFVDLTLYPNTVVDQQSQALIVTTNNLDLYSLLHEKKKIVCKTNKGTYDCELLRQEYLEGKTKFFIAIIEEI